jgi:cephalosporin hydroxylase
MNESTYFGVKLLKSPTDFWVYQEIIYETRPDVIIEIGNYYGGSALALAHICDCLGHGRVIGVDLSHANVQETVRRHARITLIEGDAGLSFDRVASLIEPEDKVLIIEDSSHTYENTLQAPNTYSPLVKPGGYFIVEDGICHHGLDGGPFPGRFEAVETFVSQRADFCR